MKNFFYIFSLVKIIVLLISKPIFADAVSAWEIASPTVVSVLPTWPGYDKPGFGAPPGTAPEGTGIIVSSDGLILTASHVISKATDVKVRDIKGELFSAKIIKNSLSTDLALLKTELELRPITIKTGKPKRIPKNPASTAAKKIIVQLGAGNPVGKVCWMNTKFSARCGDVSRANKYAPTA